MRDISITDFNATVRKRDLILSVRFKLSTSKRIFSRIRTNLHFDGQLIKSFYLGIPYYFAQREELPLRTLLSLEEVSDGIHTVKLEMAGLWSAAQPPDAREITFEYKPLRRMLMAGAMPTVKKIEGPGIAVVTDEAKRLYQEMSERRKRELAAQRER